MDYFNSFFSFPEGATHLIMVLFVIRKIVALAGVFIILWGAFTSIYAFICHHQDKKKRLHEIDAIRLNFGRTIILGLEFIVAADVIETTTTPDYYTLGILGSLVLIRTFLTYFLNREIRLIGK